MKGLVFYLYQSSTLVWISRTSTDLLICTQKSQITKIINEYFFVCTNHRLWFEYQERWPNYIDLHWQITNNQDHQKTGHWKYQYWQEPSMQLYLCIGGKTKKSLKLYFCFNMRAWQTRIQSYEVRKSRKEEFSSS